MSLLKRAANRSATAPPLHLPDAQGGYCASRTAGRPATQPRRYSVWPRGEDPSGSRRHHSPASSRVATRRNQCRHPRSPHDTAREEPATVSPLVRPRGRWRGAFQQPIISSPCFLLRGGPCSASDCSLVQRKSLKDARKEGPEERGLAGGLRPSASWGRGRGKGWGEAKWFLTSPGFGDFLDLISE